MNIYLQIIIQFLFSGLATVGYAICINIPREALLAGGLTGSIGWIIYWYCYQFACLGKVSSSLISAFSVGLISYGLAYYKKMPTTLFNIPALVPLVPGATAYQAVRAMVSGQFVNSVRLFLMVLMMIGAIAMGYMMAQVVIELVDQRTT